jgi:hypothetical protein
MSRIARISRRARVLTLLLGLGMLAGVLAPAPAARAADAAVAEPAWRVLDSTATTLRLELTIPGYERRAVGDAANPQAVALLVPGGGELGALGAPALPTVSHLVAVPAGVRVSGAVVDYHAVILDDLDLAPVTAGEGTPFTRDAAAYAIAGWQAPVFSATTATLLSSADKAGLPAPTVAVGAPAVMAGQDVVALTIAPAHYDAPARRAAACDRVVVELRFDIVDAKAASAAQRPLPRSFALLAQEQVLNLPREKTLPAAGAEPGLWVAVARSNTTLRSKLQPLIDWRKRQGYSVEVVDADAVGNSTSGIKAALQAIYDDPARPPLEFVVLVGDAGGTYGVPTWNEQLSGYGGEGDHYYGMLDGGDILADVHVGRLSFSNSSLSQLDVLVNKILNYEKTPPMVDTSWFGRALVMGDESSSGITTIWVNQWLKTQLLGLGWARVDTCWGGNFRTQMIASLNPGASVFGYRGYLGMSGIQTGDINLLTNGGKLPVAFLPTCDSGSFAGSSESRSETWMRAPNGGGIAAVGTATIGTHTRYNNAFFMGAWDGLLHGADHRVGAGQTAGKVCLYTNYYVGEPDRAQIWAVWNSLMGDPATDMWIGVPQTLTVTAPAALALGAGTLAVTVQSGAAPVSGLLVCALDAGGARVRGITDAQGHVTLAGAPFATGSLQLTVSGHGFLPYVGAVTVGQQATFCGLLSTQIIDNGTLGSSGNGNGQANPGETLALVPTLRNTGTNTAFGVSSTLSGGAPWATVTSGAQSYGDINAAQSVAAAPVALVTLAADVPDGQVVGLDLVATNGALTWNSTALLTVSAPRLSVASVAFGVPGGSIDPGEGGTLTVTLANGGSLASGALTATLSTTSPWLSVTDADGAFPAVELGGSGSNAGAPFAVYASTECFTGHLAPCTLVLSSGGETVAELPFAVTVGTQMAHSPTGPDAYGYYAFDDTDIASGHAPVYDWVELTPALGGSGVSVGLSDYGWEQDDTKLVSLPFTFRYYGKEQTELSICSNGWVAFGQCSLVSYHNAGIPGAGGTPRAMLAPFWDNLMQEGDNLVYHWYDAVEHRYIVQWRDMVQCYQGYTQHPQDFQLILLDPAYYQTISGEGMILFQYKTVNNTDDLNAYATVGIQSPDGQDGLLYSYWNHTMGGAATVAAGRAILFMPLGGLLQPSAVVTPSSVTAGVAPGGVITRDLLVTNAGDAGSLLQVSLAKLDPSVMGGNKSAGAGTGDPILTPSSIAGSTFTADAFEYDAGTTMDLHLTIDAVTGGQEWIIGMAFDAPPGVIVNASTAWDGGSNGPVASNDATGDGARVVWGGGGFLDNGQIGTATVNVTFTAGLAGNAVFGWELQGDNWGDDPHFLSGQIVLVSTGPAIRISAPTAGSVAVLGQPLTVQFQAFNGPTNVAVDLQRADGGAWETLVASTPAAGGSWTWSAVTGEPGPFARVRVRDVSAPAVADTSAVFAVGRDLGWLQWSTSTLTVPAGSSQTLQLTLDSTGLAEGVYEALLVMAGNGAPASVPITFSVSSTSAVGDTPPASVVTLGGAVPNPFNPRTVITFSVPAAQDARLDIYSLDGRLVRRLLDGQVSAGAHDVVWDGRDDAGREAASGVYFHRLSSGGVVKSGKMILAR